MADTASQCIYIFKDCAVLYAQHIIGHDGFYILVLEKLSNNCCMSSVLRSKGQIRKFFKRNLLCMARASNDNCILQWRLEFLIQELTYKHFDRRHYASYSRYQKFILEIFRLKIL